MFKSRFNDNDIKFLQFSLWRRYVLLWSIFTGPLNAILNDFLCGVEIFQCDVKSTT